MPDPNRVSPERRRLLMKMDGIVDLSPEDRRALIALPLRVAEFPADADIIRERDRAEECCLVVSGFACGYKIISNGKRQILSFYTPGDIPDLQSLYLRVMDHSIGTLAPTRVAFMPHQQLIGLTRRFPMIAAALWRDSLIEAAIFREWIVRLGRRSAYQRIAHLICEMTMRFRAAGLADDYNYTLPVTQAELADAVGLSMIHVNRTLRDMRKDGLITFQRSTITALDWEGLKQVADFDPIYLHQRRLDLS